MADSKHNLDTLLSKYIHRPIIKAKEFSNLPPLYARTGLESETTFDAEGMSNPIWQKAVQSTYNSPTNVRRLFIGDTKVSIQYFQPPMLNGDKSKYWSHYKYESGEELGKLAQTVFNYNQVMMDAVLKNEKTPDRAIITKTGLGALSAHWKMSNVEEIYITPSILVSEDIRNNFAEAEQVYMAFQANPTGKKLSSDLPLKIFEFANSANIRDIRTRFPRLRTVGFATNIERLLEIPNIINLREGLPGTLSEVGLQWYIHATKLGAPRISSFMVVDVPFENKQPCVEFSIRPGIYKYDSLVLQPFVDKYKEKVLELGRQQRDAAINSKKEEEKLAKSEYEQFLDELLKIKGENKTVAAIRLTFARSTKEDIDAVFNEMSASGKEKYRQMLGR